MEYRTIQGVEKPVSRLTQGTIMVTSDHLDWSMALLDGIFGLGGNTFDTANVYRCPGNLRVAPVER
jgi:aryl-alcohol dehydrogenase-like predicted oxidoreductase